MVSGRFPVVNFSSEFCSTEVRANEFRATEFGTGLSVVGD